MRKSAFLMLCAGLGASVQAQAGTAEADMYAGQASYGQPAASDGAMFEILGRLEQLQSEVQQLRGMVEEQAQTIADLERKQGHMYSDLDDRLQSLTTTPAASAPATPAQTQATPPAVPVQAPAAAASASAPAATAAVATPAAQTPATASPPAPATTSPTASKPATPTPQVSQGNEKEQYQQAYDTLRNGHNAQAVKMFETLLGEYPAGEFADNAQYWLAEAHKINRDYDKARAAFSKVVSQYPNSSKVPDALLKLGFIELEQQNTAKGRDYLTRVVTNYPGTTAAHLASKKLGQMPQ